MRNSSQLHLSYAILASFALFEIRKFLKIKEKYFMIFILIAIFLTSNLHLPTSLFNDMRTSDVENMVTAIKRTPNNCTIIAPFPWLVRTDSIKNNQRIAIDITRVKECIDINRIDKNSCIMFLKDEDFEKTYDEPYKYITQIFDLKLLFKQDSIEIYNATLKN